MIDWLKAHSTMLAIASAAVGFAMMVAGAGVLIRLPADYFVRQRDAQRPDARHPAIRAMWIIGKNIVGALLAIAGLLMSLPLVPGPGIVLLVVGVSLTSFPGKGHFERSMLGNRLVLQPINGLRKQFGRPPLAMGDAKVAA